MKVKVKTIKPFNDKEHALKTRKENEVFEVTPERLKEINSTIHGALVEELKEEKKNGKGN